MIRKLFSVVLGLAISLGTLSSHAAASTPTEGPLVADLDGRLLKLSEVGKWFCHDFDYPQIHCFSTGVGLESAISTRAKSLSSPSGDATIAAAYGPNDYVTVYSEPSYAGSYAHLSANYDQLWLIGWNDRISSYKSRNNQSGRFFSDWYGNGRIRDFCCIKTVPWLTSTYDNTFSSVYRT